LSPSEEISGYNTHIKRISKILSEVLSEALGLRPDYLSSIECIESEVIVCNYYPPCPEPGLTMGASNHTDTTWVASRFSIRINGLMSPLCREHL